MCVTAVVLDKENGMITFIIGDSNNPPALASFKQFCGAEVSRFNISDSEQ